MRMEPVGSRWTGAPRRDSSLLLQRSVLDWYLEVSGWILDASPSEGNAEVTLPNIEGPSGRQGRNPGRRHSAGNSACAGRSLAHAAELAA